MTSPQYDTIAEIRVANALRALRDMNAEVLDAKRAAGIPMTEYRRDLLEPHRYKIQDARAELVLACDALKKLSE